MTITAVLDELLISRYVLLNLIKRHYIETYMDKHKLSISDEDFEKIGFNPIEVAKMEFAAGVIPLTIKRPLPGIAKVEQ